MTHTIFLALFICLCRICDVSIGTVRTILVVQGRKYYAALAGFMEVFIWISAMSFIVKHLDNPINLVAYATGFALGNLVGITLEQKLGFGYIQINLFSNTKNKEIAERLRELNYAVTLLPAEGVSGKFFMLIIIIKKKEQTKVIKEIEKLDPSCFYTIHNANPHRGYFQGAGK
jgi:uncharacterized protein YebE (UPF0316 family)